MGVSPRISSYNNYPSLSLHPKVTMFSGLFCLPQTNTMRLRRQATGPDCDDYTEEKQIREQMGRGLPDDRKDFMKPCRHEKKRTCTATCDDGTKKILQLEGPKGSGCPVTV